MSQHPDQNNTLHKCPWCDVVKSLRGLACHAGKMHRQPASELHKFVLHDGQVPLCICGCGQPVKWLQKHFGEYLRGHNGFGASARAAKASKAPLVPVNTPEVVASATVRSIPSPLPSAQRARKASIAELSKEPIVCAQCGTKTARHVRCDECPSCGPRARQIRASFEAALKDLDPAFTLAPDGSWRAQGRAAFLDAPLSHSLPGPLLSRSQVENETFALVKSGLKVLRFYEDEWIKRHDVIVSIVKHSLGLSKNRLYARSCDIVELSQAERKSFFDRCHLEGDTRALVAFGLRDRQSGAVVAVVSAREPFHKTVHAGKVEIARFACELDTAVAGAQSKLIDRLLTWGRERGYVSMLSYADGRLGDGLSYEKVGFERVKRGSPRLWWTDYVSRFNRFKVRADSANGITQNQRAIQEGVVEMWGCGNVTFERQLTPAPSRPTGLGDSCEAVVRSGA